MSRKKKTEIKELKFPDNIGLTPLGGWRKCDEEHPKCQEMVLVQWEYDEKYAFGTRKFVFRKPFEYYCLGMWFDDEGWLLSEDEVKPVLWCPLPAPYEGE